MELPPNTNEQKNRSSSFSFADGNDCSNLWNDDEEIKMDLYTACAIGHYSCVQQHLADGVEIADLDKHNCSGWTPLMYAAYIGHDNIVNLLLDNSTDVNSRTKTNGATPLMLAASCGNESVVYFLLQNGAKVDIQDNRGWTSLFYATCHGHLEVVKTLIKAKANTELREYTMGLTPLLAAAKEGHEVIFEVLLRSNASLEARTKTGKDARSLALHHGNMAVVNIIDQQSFHPEPNYLLRSEPGLLPDDTDPHGNNFDNPHWPQAKSIIPSSGIRDGPEAFEKMMNNQRKGEPMNIPILPRRQENPVAGSPYCLSVTPKSPEGPAGSFEEPFLYNCGRTVESASLHKHLQNVSIESERNKNAQNHGTNPPTIASFLDELKLSQYLSAFEENDVDFNTLLTFTENELKEVGINLFGPRRKISTALFRWKERRQSTNDEKGTKKSKSLLHQAEMQFCQTTPQVQQLQAQLTQEKDLHLVLDRCLIEERAKRQELFNRVRKLQKHWKHVEGELETLEALNQDLTKYLNLRKDHQAKELHDKLQASVMNLRVFVQQGATGTNSILFEQENVQSGNPLESSGSSSS